MVKNNKDYSKSKIYKIWSPLGDDIYIGSTTKEYLSQRMTTHRADYKKYLNGGKFISSYLLFEKYGIDNCYIELIESKECNNSDELKKLEGGYIRNMKCINKNIPDGTHDEWINKNPLYMKEYYIKNKNKQKEYYEKNKEHIRNTQKKYNEMNKLNNIEETREKRKEYMKTYRKKLKDKLNL